MDTYSEPETQRALVVPTDWVVQECTTRGCTVLIRFPIGRAATTMPVCRWCQEGTAYYRKASSKFQPHMGERMTLDEFGRDLYDAIVLRATAVMAQNGAERMRATGHDKAAKEAEEAATRADTALHRILDKGTLQPNDIRRLMAIT